nr:phospholipase A2 inhibitor and Ly6/PLAUR domain-containing protein-like isoform X3 [Pogona vitticeps]
MQALLRLFLSFLLPTIGASIQCEVCYSVGNSCTGNMQTCPSGQDICTVAFSESTLDGQRILTTEKGCENSEICASSPVDLYLGQGKSYRAHLYCCTGDACGNISPELPPEQMNSMWTAS